MTQPGTQHHTRPTGDTAPHEMVGGGRGRKFGQFGTLPSQRRATSDPPQSAYGRPSTPDRSGPRSLARRPDIKSLQKENGGSKGTATVWPGARQVAHTSRERTGNTALQGDGLDYLRAMASLRQPVSLVKVVQPVSMAPSARVVACPRRLPPRVVLCPRLVPSTTMNTTSSHCILL